jgi:Na+-driven multidrug efflux pump
MEREIDMPIPAERRETLANLVWEAIRGSHRDFTKESMSRAILLLAIPMVIEMMAESLFAIVDIFWVGKLGADAVSTVGLTESMLTVVYAMAMGLSIGAMALVARRTGEKRPEEAARAAAQAIWLGVGLAVLVTGRWASPWGRSCWWPWGRHPPPSPWARATPA